MAQKQSLAQLIRNRGADAEQAELRKQFLESAPAVFHAAVKVFGPLKIDKVRQCSV